MGFPPFPSAAVQLAQMLVAALGKHSCDPPAAWRTRLTAAIGQSWPPPIPTVVATDCPTDSALGRVGIVTPGAMGALIADLPVRAMNPQFTTPRRFLGFPIRG